MDTKPVRWSVVNAPRSRFFGVHAKNRVVASRIASREDAYAIAAAPAYAKAWAMVPEATRERILAAVESWVAEDIEAATRGAL